MTVQLGHDGSGTVTSAMGGISCGSTCTASVADGTAMVLTAMPDAGSSFAGWSGACTDTSSTCRFTVSGDVTVGAAFDRKRHTIAVMPNGDGAGTVSSMPGGLSCPGACSLTVPEGTQVALTAVAQPDSVFLGWGGGSCTGTGSCVVTVNADQNVTANFVLNRSLVVNKTGSGTGTVTSSPNGIACGATCSASFPQGTVVTLTAAAATESRFAGWTGAGCSGTGSCTVTLNASMMVEAQFEHLCGSVGQACCTIGPACGSGSGCLNNTCTTCPPPPQTTTLVDLPDEQDGSNCLGVNNIHVYGRACASGTHHEQCQVIANNPPPNSSCSVASFGVGGPGDCICQVLFHTSANCTDRIHCSVKITQTTNPPPHPAGCP